jgi:flavin-binding protein dodecin
MNDHVYKHLDLTGSSTTNLEDAIQNAISRAGKTLRDIRWFEVKEIRGHVEGGKVAHWQVTLRLAFTLEE